MSAFAKVLILVPFVILFLPNIASVPEFSMGDKIGSIRRYLVTNSSNITAACLNPVSQSTFKDVLQLMGSGTTNVIDLHVWIESVNATMNKTQVLKGIKWANEIGRTLISLIAQAEKSKPITLPWYTSTLTAGVYGVNIVVAEETMRCMFSGNNITDQAIFDLLVHQLYYMSGNKTDYNLCRPHNDKNQVPEYNCCTIVGRNDIPICSDYSSIVTKVFPILVVITVFFLMYIDFPIILEYLSQYKEDNKHYRISDSPMSLSSILHSVFVEGHGPVKSFGRKLMFVIFVFVTTLPEWGNSLLVYLIFVCPWALIFLFSDTFTLNENDHLTIEPLQLLSYTFKNPIEIIVLPFNLKWWHKVSTKWPRFYRNLELTRNSSFQQSETNPELPPTTQESQEERLLLLPRPENNRQEGDRRFGFLEIMKYRFSILILLVVYLITLPLLCLLVLILLFIYNHIFLTVKPQECGIIKHIFVLWFFLTTFLLIMVSITDLFLLTFYLIVGLFLNGEIYSPYLVPFATILFYAWATWRTSVETKYLALTTNIYKVCKRTIGAVESGENSNSVTENGGNVNNTPRSSTTGPFGERFNIELNDDRGPIIPKKLYDLVRERLLPYDRILFHYFQGVFFIAIFAYLLYIMMSLAQKSGISNSVQIIGTIAATSLPFIFDFVWKKSSDEQREANSIVLKSKLKRLLLVQSFNNTTGGMVVEFTGND
ncbi:Hypothetical predicted protein [Paramuricea clavata]|uniref:Uncharacterized protein n=1 Tax=Paramuricea clavata TaxID=317549 RepID=A0A7D9DKX3_PARCT|nr:Hypothetical predicted protein [Paramuricea clavata]